MFKNRGKVDIFGVRIQDLPKVLIHCPFSHKLGKVLHSSISWPSGPNPDSKHNLSKASVPLPGQISQLFDIPKVELDFSAEPHAAPMAQQHSAFVTVICCWLPKNDE